MARLAAQASHSSPMGSRFVGEFPINTDSKRNIAFLRPRTKNNALRTKLTGGT